LILSKIVIFRHSHASGNHIVVLGKPFRVDFRVEEQNQFPGAGGHKDTMLIAKESCTDRARKSIRVYMDLGFICVAIEGVGYPIGNSTFDLCKMLVLK
jgi:hypothetical protein